MAKLIPLSISSQPIAPPTAFYHRGALTRFGLVTMMLFGLNACADATSKSSSKASASKASASSPAPAASVATPANSDSKIQQALAANLTKSGINAKILSVTPTTMPNMYWVKAEGMSPFFTDNTGQYIVQGQVLKVGGNQPEHISADLLAQDTKAALATIDKKDMIIFPATGTPKGALYVFTDADCGYCRKLHSEINQINALGIEVRYLPWPRSEQTFPIMEKIWCSKDRAAALTQAKQGMPVEAAQCDNPVRRIHDLGLNLGITGTPAIFTEQGRQIGGYLPPEELLKAMTAP